MKWRKCNSFSQLFLYDVFLQTGDKREKLAFFFRVVAGAGEKLFKLLMSC